MKHAKRGRHGVEKHEETFDPESVVFYEPPPKTKRLTYTLDETPSRRSRKRLALVLAAAAVALVLAVVVAAALAFR